MPRKSPKRVPADRAVAPASLEIRLFGSFRVAVDGESVADERWRQRKPALLLQRLAVEPHHRLHAEQLMDALWPEADPDAARNALHKALHMVRSALEPDLARPADSHFLLMQGRQVVLAAPRSLWIDVDEFQTRAAAAARSGEPEMFEEAIALYEGPLLPGEPYEEWIIERREQLAELHQHLLVELARLHEQRSDYERAAEVFNRLIAADSANEIGHRGLMRLYAATGRKQMALRQYRDCCDALQRELAAEPDRTTVRLYEQVVAGTVKPEATPGFRLAVLPFQNGSGDRDLDYLSDGMTERIIAGLSRLPQIQVMAHATVSRHASSAADPQQVAQAMHVRIVVTGRILQHNDRLLVRAEMIDAADGSRLWGDEYERGPTDLIGVEGEIVSRIAERLGVTTGRRGGTGRPHTENPEAYRLFLLGRHLWNRRTLDAVTRSIEYFQKAIEIDPDYALAWIGLADSYTKLGDVGVSASPPREAFGKGKIAAIRAVGLDSSLAEAHTSLAHLFMHDYEWEEAEREFRVSLRLNANDATTHEWFAYALLMTGRTSECFSEIRRAVEIDPLSLAINTDYGELLYYARDYDAALDQYGKALELDPHFYSAHLGLGGVLLQMGRYDEALFVLRRASELSGDSNDALAALARGHAMTGDRQAARQILARLDEMSRTQYVSAYGKAAVLASLQEIDAAFISLQRACDEHAAWSIYVGVDPRLDPLRADARFGGILKTVGLERFDVRSTF